MKFTLYIVEFKISSRGHSCYFREKGKKFNAREKKQNKRAPLDYHLTIKETNSKNSAKYLELAFLTLEVNIIIFSEH